MKYVYPAIILEEDNNTFSVVFPDFSGGAQGDTLSEAITEANTALSLLISSYIDNGETLPEPTEFNKVSLDEDLIDYKDKYSVTLLQVDPEPFLKNNRVRKNVTIPKYLAKMGEADKLNFSKLLTEALELKYQS